MLILFKAQQAVEKLRCILPLPHLFPSLARCFVSLRTLWAYGFDSAARRALEKSKVGEKEKYFISFNQLYFLKSYIEVTNLFYSILQYFFRRYSFS